MVINIKPVPKPRMTRSDAWKKRKVVTNYWKYKEELQRLTIGFELPKSFKIVFGIKPPSTISNSKRLNMIGTPHQKRPDLDNLLKAFLDCLAIEDKSYWHVDARKIWAAENFILIEKNEDDNLGEV